MTTVQIVSNRGKVLTSYTGTAKEAWKSAERMVRSCSLGSKPQYSNITGKPAFYGNGAYAVEVK